MKQCEGCNHEEDFIDGCKVYFSPVNQWTRIGGCAMATHTRKIEREVFNLNPLKMSKRGVRQ